MSRKRPGGVQGPGDLWKIFWKEDEEAEIEEQMVDMTHYEFTTQNTRVVDEPRDIHSVNSHTLGDGVTSVSNPEPDVVLFEKKTSQRTTEGTNGEVPVAREFSEQNWDSLDLSRSGDLQQGSQYGSDTDLFLRSSRQARWTVKLRHCCAGCRQWPVWKNYVWIVVVAIATVVLYIVVAYAIIKALSG